jgi:hypothetical protein
METQQKTIHVVCNDKEYFLDENLLSISNLYTTIKDCDPSVSEINWSSISNTFEQIIPYLVHRNGKHGPEIERPKTMSENCNDKWAVEYINKFNKQELIALLHTANYLNIQCLLSLCGCKIATIIQNLDKENVKNCKK